MTQISVVVVPKPDIALLVHFYISYGILFVSLDAPLHTLTVPGVVLKSLVNNSTITLFYEGISTPPLVDLFLSRGVLTPSYSSS